MKLIIKLYKPDGTCDQQRVNVPDEAPFGYDEPYEGWMLDTELQDIFCDINELLRAGGRFEVAQDV